MKNGLSSIGAEETIVTLIRTEGFNQLSDENKQMIITTLQDSKDKEKEGGFMGKMFGTRKENASMHIAFFLANERHRYDSCYVYGNVSLYRIC